MGNVQPFRNYYCQKILPAVYDDSFSYYELLCKLTDKLNEVISYIGDTATIAILEAAIAALEEEIEELSDSVDSRFASQKTYIDTKTADLKTYVDEQDDSLKTYSDNKNNELELKLLRIIQGLGLDNVMVLGQTIGKIVPINEELNREYDYLRYFAVTAEVHDDNEKTAQELDTADKTAYWIDLYNICRQPISSTSLAFITDIYTYGKVG